MYKPRVSPWLRRLLGGSNPFSFWIGVASAFDISGGLQPRFELGTPQDDLDALAEDWKAVLGDAVDYVENDGGQAQG